MASGRSSKGVAGISDAVNQVGCIVQNDNITYLLRGRTDGVGVDKYENGIWSTLFQITQNDLNRLQRSYGGHLFTGINNLECTTLDTDVIGTKTVTIPAYSFAVIVLCAQTTANGFDGNVGVYNHTGSSHIAMYENSMTIGGEKFDKRFMTMFYGNTTASDLKLTTFAKATNQIGTVTTELMIKMIPW